MRSTLSCPRSKASMAASWPMIGAQRMEYWWIFIMASMRADGAQANPIRQPVMANAFDNPCKKTVRSFMPGNVAMLVWVAPS